MKLRQHLTSPDVVAILILILLWLLFFWRLFTPFAEDQASLKQGDFSGQFVAFGGYQYARFAEGEIPLWNPYNNGGLPFIADTQAAVFYPPRLVTIALSRIAGGWSYNALQLEMTAHILLYSLLMYAFVRRLTFGQIGSVFGSFVASVITAYGGFMSGYPPLQLAILEAAVWFPLSALGIHEAARHEKINGRWLLLAGFALGFSWMAGHPQSSWMLTYLLIAYFAYRAYVQRYRLVAFVGGLALFGGVTLGVTAVQFLPSVEYLILTTRSGLGFDEKGNGFPFHDVAQFIFPSSVSLWSPLYIGIAGVVFAGVAVKRRLQGSVFWAGVAVFALAYSFGANSIVYHLAYNILPGARFFRGQERMALVVSDSLAILAGMGATYLIGWNKSESPIRFLRWLLFGLMAFCGITALIVFVLWLGNRSTYDETVKIVFFSFMVSISLCGLVLWLIDYPKSRNRQIALAGLLIFELFTVNVDNTNYAPVAAYEQLSMTPPPLIQQVLEDDTGQPFRVDGFRALRDNYGSLYGVMDIRGISPLFLTGPQHIIYKDYLDNPLAWELFAVKYVFSDRQQISAENSVVGEGHDKDGPIQLRQLTNPRPYALLVYDADVLDSDEFAFALLDDPNFDARETVILDAELTLRLPQSAPETHSAEIREFAPERVIIEVTTPDNAILSIAQPDYPGWTATINDNSAPIYRAYGALIAIEVPTGKHTVTLIFNPASYRIGAILSLFTWITLAILGSLFLMRRWSLTVGD